MFFLTYFNDYKDRFTVGYFNSLMKANLGLSNLNYQYAVIEQIDAGLNMPVKHNFFYMRQGEQWVNYGKPESFRHINKFALT